MNERLSISQQLKRRRKELGLSLAAMAVRADTSTATLSRYENGWSKFETNTLRKLATALGCDLQIELRPRIPLRQSGLSRNNAVKRLARLFWDHKLTKSDLDTYPVWIQERILEYGNLQDVHLLLAITGRERFLQNAAKMNKVSPRTAGFWKGILQREGIPCTKKYSRNTAWNS